MENSNVKKLIDKILNDLEESGINTKTVIDDLIKLREYAREASIPLVVKVLRLTYTHIQENDSFLIPIPADEPLEEDDLSDSVEPSSPVESLKYLISLIKNLKNKSNISDLKAYRDLLNEF